MPTSSRSPLAAFSAAAAGTTNGDDQPNFDASGVSVIIDITVATTTSVVYTIQGKDATSGKYYDILTSAALTGVATTVLTVYPGVTVASNVAASQPLPRVWRLKAVVTGASSALTATHGANYLV